jgi:dTDP-4-amino-4,6-dideoxygalactose transaminase
LGVAQDVAAWRSWCDARGVLLVEDDAQGWLGAAQGKPLGTTGDIALFSLYKSVGVPDGGAVVVRGEPIGPARLGKAGASAALVKHGAWLASRWGPLGSLWASRRRTRAYDAEKDFALGDPESPAVAVTGNLAVRLAVPAVAETRRRHYRRLLEALQRWVPEPFVRDLGAASPFAFPVQVTHKQRAISIMAEHGVVAVDAWSVPHPSLPAGSFPIAARRRASVVLLPVHQELRDRDLDRIIVAARSALGATK